MNYGKTLTVKCAVFKRLQRVMILTHSLPQRSFILLCVLLLSTHRGALYSYYPQSSTAKLRRAQCSYISNENVFLLFVTIVITIYIDSFVSHYILGLYFMSNNLLMLVVLDFPALFATWGDFRIPLTLLQRFILKITTKENIG